MVENRTVSTSALKHVTEGTYQRALVNDEGESWVVSTEFELEDFSGVICASGKDEMFSWIRYQIWIYASATSLRYEWMLLKMNSVDALPDLNDNDVVEKLHKDKRIFARGLMSQTIPANGLRMLKGELYNVKLVDGEELRIVVRPFSAINADGYVKGIIEYRKIGA